MTTVFRAIGLDFASRFCGVADGSQCTHLSGPSRGRVVRLFKMRSTLPRSGPRTMSLVFLPPSPLARAVFPQRRTRRRALTVPLQQPALIFVHHYCNDASLHWALPADHLQLLRDGRQCVEEGRRHVKTRRSNSRPGYLRPRHAAFPRRRPAAAAYRDVDPLAV